MKLLEDTCSHQRTTVHLLTQSTFYELHIYLFTKFDFHGDDLGVLNDNEIDLFTILPVVNFGIIS